MTEPAYRYIVVRAAPDLPEGFVPPDWEGRWLDLDQVPEAWKPDVGSAVAVATDRFERNSSGQTARVYEVRP